MGSYIYSPMVFSRAYIVSFGFIYNRAKAYEEILIKFEDSEHQTVLTGAKMTMSEIAIGISIISVLIAGLSLGWNIYRDVILKANVKISFAIMTLVQVGISARPEYVNITATNFGPGPVNLSMIEIKGQVHNEYVKT